MTRIFDPDKSEYEQQPALLPRDPRYRLVGWDWSPDGKKIGGVIAEGNRRHIGYYSFDTNQYHVVIENSEATLSWLPDSRRFVYAEGNKIFIGDIESSVAVEILSIPNIWLRTPRVSRDGTLLYYVASTNESDIWLLDLTAEQ